MFAPVQLMKAGDKGKNIPVKKDVQLTNGKRHSVYY